MAKGGCRVADFEKFLGLPGALSGYRVSCFVTFAGVCPTITPAVAAAHYIRVAIAITVRRCCGRQRYAAWSILGGRGGEESLDSIFWHVKKFQFVLSFAGVSMTVP